MNFGNLKIPCGAALAPMAGATDKAMRHLCAKHGAVYTISEMVSVKAISMGDKKSLQLLKGGSGDALYGIQLFGSDPQDFITAIDIINQMSISYDFIDLNMGCPAPKITRSGAGSALLKTPLLAQEIVKSAVLAAKTPVTVKIRIGWDEALLTGLEIAKRSEAAGALAVTVHARTRAEMYNPGVHYDEVQKIKNALSIPVIVNGDITSVETAYFALQQTNCDGVMIGRAAMGNPWLFEQIAAAFNSKQMPPPPTLDMRLETMRRHIKAMCDDKGEGVAMNEARSHAAWYMHGLRGAAQLRRECCSLTHYRDLDYLIDAVYKFQKD